MTTRFEICEIVRDGENITLRLPRNPNLIETCTSREQAKACILRYGFKGHYTVIEVLYMGTPAHSDKDQP